MLVAIKMGKSQACILKTGDLRRDLTLNFIPANACQQGPPEKFTTRTGQASTFINQGWQYLAAKDGLLFHQRQMQANIQFRLLPSERDGIVERAPGHKQRRTRYDSILKSPKYPSVDSRRQAQVISVNNQLFQGEETRAARISRRIFIRNLTSS